MAIFKGAGVAIVTPFKDNYEVNFEKLGELIDFQINNQTDAIIICGTTGESATLSIEEHKEVIRYCIKRVAGRVPVIASGHISDSLEEQIHELKLIAETGVDAVIMITNRMAAEDESDEVWISNTEKILEALPSEIRFGLYECPYPYKRVMSPKVTEWCASTGRFYFLKDTCCDADQIREKLAICKDTHLKLYNANTATLLESLKDGAYGYCGVMANMHPRLYRILYDRYQTEDMTELSEFLTMAALIERQCYPVNAKYYLNLEGLHMGLHSRVKNAEELSETFKKEVKMLRNLSERMEKSLKR